jgi:hypothetical protein
VFSTRMLCYAVLLCAVKMIIFSDCNFFLICFLSEDVTALSIVWYVCSDAL